MPFVRAAGRSKCQFDLPAAGQIDSAAAQNDFQMSFAPHKIESKTIYLGWGNGFPFNLKFQVFSLNGFYSTNSYQKCSFSI